MHLKEGALADAAVERVEPKEEHLFAGDLDTCKPHAYERAHARTAFKHGSNIRTQEGCEHMG